MPTHHAVRQGRRLLTALIVIVALALIPSHSVWAQPPAAAAGLRVDLSCRYYTVRNRDTLIKIANRFGISVEQLKRANKIRDVDRIYVGQQLCLPIMEQVTDTLEWPKPAVGIQVFSPVVGGLYHSPIEVIGLARSATGAISLRLTLADGEVIAERQTTAGKDKHTFFQTFLRFETYKDAPEPAVLEVFEAGREGAEINKVVVALTLAPGQRVLDVTQPTAGVTVCNPVAVAGYSFTFEGNVNLAAVEGDGAVIVQSFATGGGGSYEDWQTELGPLPASARAIFIDVFDISGADGSPIDQIRIPVLVQPRGSQNCP